MKYEDNAVVLRDREKPQKWYGFLFTDIHGDEKLILDHESEVSISQRENWSYQSQDSNERKSIEITEKELLEAIKEIANDQ